MRSEKLIQLDRPILPSRDTREAEHIQIDREIAEYLARGGEIHQVTQEDCHAHQQPIKRTRRDQVDFNRRWFNGLTRG